MDHVRQEVEFILARHAIPASRDRVAMGILIEHVYKKMCRKFERLISQKFNEMGSEQSRLIKRVRQEDVLSWTESLSSSQSVAWGYDNVEEQDTENSYFTQERLTEDPDSPVFFLSLAFENLITFPLEKISDKLLNSVQSLDMTKNHIKEVQFLAEFESLTTINLDHNQIHCLTVFPKMPKLHSLSLNSNRVSSAHPFITSLAIQCPNLKFLSLMANEVCPNYLNGGTEQQNEIYRHFVIRCFPKLEYLDDCPISSFERQRALESTVAVNGYQCSSDEGIDTE